MNTRTFKVTIAVHNGDDMTVPAALDYWNAQRGIAATLEWVDDEELFED